MKKLQNWFRKLDDNLVHISLLAFIVLVSLLPKIPLQHIEYTYIRLRIDDILPIIPCAIFLIQWLRGKITLNTKFLIPIILFWTAVFISFFVGSFIEKTVVVRNIGLLHSARRIQYMAIFFVASSAIISEKRFKLYMKVYLVTLLIVALYGFGQRFLAFPSIQSMNPAYVDGRLLILNPEDRINSTFGGHFDLAAYLTFSMPILLGFYFAFNQIRYFVTFVIGLIILLLTAARSSFGAYVLSTHAYLLQAKKYKMFVVVLLLTGILTLVTGDMAKRIESLIQIKTIFVNDQSGVQQIDQHITTKNLPAGGYDVSTLPFLGKVITKKNLGSPNVTANDIEQAAIAEAVQEAKMRGEVYNDQEIHKRANEIAKYIHPKRSILCDISCATRLQIEWPRAVGAFMYNPIFGTGPSSITEATDNDFLRWLGETGLLGTSLFLWLLFSICNFVRKSLKYVKGEERMIYKAFIFGVIALLINGLYIDVFEASKVAYNFWLVAGMYVGMGTLLMKQYRPMASVVDRHTKKSKRET